MPDQQKTWFVFQGAAVWSKHRSKQAAIHAARVAIRHWLRLGLTYTSAYVRQLNEPGYWGHGDTPTARLYYIGDPVEVSLDPAETEALSAEGRSNWRAYASSLISRKHGVEWMPLTGQYPRIFDRSRIQR